MKNIRRNTSLVSGIYCIINLTNSKIYIGSSINIYKRLNEHLGLLRKNKHGTQHLQHSFNKYGEDMFYSIILEECAREILEYKEEYWINLLDADYNVIKTNLSRPALSFSEETKRSIGNKISQYHKEGLFDSKKKEIHVYDLKGNYIQSFDSCKECYESLNFNSKGLFDIVSGITNHYKGYQFRFEYVRSIDPLVIISHSEQRRKEQSERMKGHSHNKGGNISKESIEKRVKTRALRAKGVKIIQYGLEGNFLKEWNNIDEIVNSLKCSKCTIDRNLRGATKFTKYGIWKYKEEVEQLEIKEENENI